MTPEILLGGILKFADADVVLVIDSRGHDTALEPVTVFSRTRVTCLASMLDTATFLKVAGETDKDVVVRHGSVPAGP